MSQVEPRPRGRLLRFLPLLLIAGAVAAAFAFGWTDYLRLDQLRERREQLQGFVADNRVLSLAAYVALYALVAALSLPGGAVLTLAGGFLFGALPGGSAAVTGATLGGTVIFLAMRTAVGDSLRRRMGDRGARIVDGLRDDAFSYLLTLRLLPVAPFWLVNLAAGLVEMKLRTFVLATFLGIIPGTFIYAWVGQGLGTLFERGGEPDLGLIFRPEILLPLLALVLLALAPAVVKRLRARKADL